MKPSSFCALALATLAPATASAQAAPWGGLSPPAAVGAGAPLVVESTGREQDVRLLRTGPVLCQTPCTLQVAPGPYSLSTGGRGLRMADVPVTVGAGGLRVRVRAASRARFVGGVIMVAGGGASVLVLGAFGLAALLSAPDDSYNQFIGGITGTMALVLGVPLLVGGFALVNGAASGPERIDALTAAPRRWSMGLAPLSGGALAALRVTF